MRCKQLLTDAEQLQAMFQLAAGEIRGRVRIDMPSMFAQEIIIPHLPALLAAHPRLDLGISTNDRQVDMVLNWIARVTRPSMLETPAPV